ncbi:MAG: hypothetical protein ABSE80_10060 [Halobacteriota archaeon]|jgi:hypothetical protein
MFAAHPCFEMLDKLPPFHLAIAEPTTGLDSRAQLWLTELLQDLAKAGKTIITATHDMDIVEQVSMRSKKSLPALMLVTFFRRLRCCGLTGGSSLLAGSSSSRALRSQSVKCRYGAKSRR